MKFLLNIFYITFFSLLLISCNNDTAIGPSTETSNYYEWSTIPISLSYVGNISAAKNQTLFVSGTKSYKITNGVTTEINFNDSTFFSSLVFAYDDTYAAFLGGSMGQQFLKIYDNGVIYTYSWSPTTSIGDIYFEQKNKFFYCNPFSSTYYLFNSGTMVPYTLPSYVYPRYIRKIGENVYLFADSYAGGSATQAYKISTTGFTLAYSGAVQGQLFPLTNDLIRITQDSLNHKFEYFSEAGWQNLFSYASPTNLQYVNPVAGGTKSFFLYFAFNYSGDYTASVYNGNSITQQSNFITTTFSGGTGGTLLSNYADNTLYFVNKLDATKIIKAKLK